MSNDPMDWPAGTECWWIEREGGRVVHLTRVRLRRVVSWMPGRYAVSVRSGRRYACDPEDLLPLDAVGLP